MRSMTEEQCQKNNFRKEYAKMDVKIRKREEEEDEKNVRRII